MPSRPRSKSVAASACSSSASLRETVDGSTPIARRAADGAEATERQKYAHIVPVESFSGAVASLHKCNASLKYWA